ncbi:hypothetical protein NQ317_013325 [Molorchus minor]|uniref:Sulfatase N-terminal domain-containing protein n=1 Tax=Molorchus minor TaxID=1323400 RepID=A0ABQ9K1S0_9CUCU|nr:hypothetical protein NQ317_013325 [Molorchus minor]
MLFNEPEIQYKYKNIVDNTQDEPGDSICCKQKEEVFDIVEDDPSTSTRNCTSDDLKPAINSFGDKAAYTPNIDRLAEKSFIFKNAFAQIEIREAEMDNLAPRRLFHLRDNPFEMLSDIISQNISPDQEHGVIGDSNLLELGYPEALCTEEFSTSNALTSSVYLASSYLQLSNSRLAGVRIPRVIPLYWIWDPGALCTEEFSTSNALRAPWVSPPVIEINAVYATGRITTKSDHGLDLQSSYQIADWLVAHLVVNLHFPKSGLTFLVSLRCSDTGLLAATAAGSAGGYWLLRLLVATGCWWLLGWWLRSSRTQELLKWIHFRSFIADFGLLMTCLRLTCSQALCAPSRNSLLTSRRPDSLHLYDFYSYWRAVVGNFTTLPQYFKEHGYFTYSVGKVFHPGNSSNFTDDFPYSWSVEPFHPKTDIYKNAKVCINKDGTMSKNLICPVVLEFQPERTLPDVESLKRAMYFLENKEEITNKPTIFRCRPSLLPDVAWNPWNDIRERDDIKELNVPFPYGPIPDNVLRKIKQAYYASTSYIDDLIGTLMQKVGNNTIVVLTGDHDVAHSADLRTDRIQPVIVGEGAKAAALTSQGMGLENSRGFCV